MFEHPTRPPLWLCQQSQIFELRLIQLCKLIQQIQMHQDRTILVNGRLKQGSKERQVS